MDLSELTFVELGEQNLDIELFDCGRKISMNSSATMQRADRILSEKWIEAVFSTEELLLILMHSGSSLYNRISVGVFPVLSGRLSTITLQLSHRLKLFLHSASNYREDILERDKESRHRSPRESLVVYSS